MERASKAIKRGSIRIKSIGTGHRELNLVICGLNDMSMTFKSFMHSQSTAAQDLARWAGKIENRAIRNTFAHLMELNAILESVHREFIDQLKECKKHFQMIYEGERRIDHARSELAACEAAESTIRRDIKKATKKENGAEVASLEKKLAQAQRTKALTQIDVVDKVQEHEAVKHIRVKESQIRLAEAYLDLSQKAQIIFESHKEIAMLLPDVQDKCIHDLQYDGSMAAKTAVTRARERIHQWRRPTSASQATCVSRDGRCTSHEGLYASHDGSCVSQDGRCPSRDRRCPSRDRIEYPSLDLPPPYSPIDQSSPYGNICIHNSDLSYPDELNPFSTPNPRALNSRSGPFMVNGRIHRDTDNNVSGQQDSSFLSDYSLSPPNASGRSPYLASQQRPDPADEDGELAGAVGGIRFSN